MHISRMGNHGKQQIQFFNNEKNKENILNTEVVLENEVCGGVWCDLNLLVWAHAHMITCHSWPGNSVD